MRKWYKFSILFWLVTAAPIIVLGVGMGGGSLKPPRSGTLDVALWALSALILFYPIVLAPFGFRGEGTRRMPEEDC